MNFIYADALTHPIVDIVEDHRLFSLKRYFNRFPLKERQKVKTITINIYPPYINLIRNMFPNAHIIIDRFHIVQSIHRALNMARVSAMNDLKNAHRPDYNKCKRYWKLVLKPTENLESFEYKKRKSLMNRYITRGIANNLPNILQHQLWQLVSEREQEQTKDNTSVDYFHIFQFNKHRNQLYIKHKQERPAYVKTQKANINQPININKVYIIREDDVGLSYYVMLLPNEY
ncbi:hypothetical protein BUZ50_03945 [Staphylococcus hominis]|nr:hypothetical protein BUZ50_03945 [Staphylococcus hominis]